MLHCRECGGDYQPIYDACPTCGIPLEGELPKPPRSIPTLPVAWAGFFFVVPDLILMSIRQATDEMGEVAALFRLIQFGLVAFWLWCVYRLHEVFEAASDGNYPISAGAAVGWHFAPIFNLYWVMKWTKVAAGFLRSRAPELNVPGTALGLIVLAGSFARPFVPVLGTVLMFAALQWIVSKSRVALNAPA